MKKKVCCLSIIFCILMLCCTAYNYYAYHSHKTAVYDKKKSELIATTKRATRDLDGFVRRISDDVDQLAEDLSNQVVPYEQASGALYEMVVKNSFITSAVIAFEPYQYDDNIRLFASFAKRDGDTIVEMPLGYDYTDESQFSLWYITTKENKKVWLEPFWGRSTQTRIVAYGTTFFYEGKTAGVILASISLDEVARMIKHLDLGPGGFGALVSAGGRYIYHPNNRLVTDGKGLFEIGIERDDTTRLEMWNLRGKDVQGVRNHISTTTGLSSWFIYATVSTTRWSLQNTFILRDLSFDNQCLRHHLLRCVLCIVFFFVFLLASVILGLKMSDKGIWILSAIFSSILLLAIICVWYLALNYAKENECGSHIVYNESDIQKNETRFKYEYKRINKNGVLYSVPTGVFINNIQFKDQNTLSVNGVIWQKFAKELPSDLSRSFVFPNAVVRKLECIDEIAYQQYNLVKWAFEVDIVKNFDQGRYPLDYEQIGLRVQHSGSKFKVMLTPDIDDYKVTAPTALPFINKNLSIAGWHIVEAYFSLSTEKETANLGAPQTFLNHFYPTLKMNFIIQRKFMDVFIANLTPIILVLFLLFVGQMISNIDGKYIDRFKSDDLPKLISFCSGLLFIVVFAHIGIREKLDAEKLFLLEYFYLISYFAFFYVIVNIILYKVNVRLLLITERNNLFYKALFWPLIFGAIFTVSFVTFY
jgi:hypothetical protein